MKAVILGSAGLLGSVLMEMLVEKGITASGFDRDQIDATDLNQLKALFESEKPDLLFNCIAYNSVDGAETSEGREIAFKLNSDLPRQIAKLCTENKCTIVHYSSGYVFDGESETGYSEAEQTSPISVYGESKLAGEKAVAEECPDYYLIRLNWLFGKPKQTQLSQASKKSFPEIVLDLAEKYLQDPSAELKFVSNEFAAPTYAGHLAASCLHLTLSKYPNGIYHMENDGKASWLDYAREVLDLNGHSEIQIKPISAGELSRPARRPKNSVLLNTKYPKIRDWRQALKAYYNK